MAEILSREAAVNFGRGQYLTKSERQAQGTIIALYDQLAEVERITEAERAVIAAAVAWGTKYPVDPEGDASRALYEKVRALKEQRG